MAREDDVAPPGRAATVTRAGLPITSEMVVVPRSAWTLTAAIWPATPPPGAPRGA